MQNILKRINVALSIAPRLSVFGHYGLSVDSDPYFARRASCKRSSALGEFGNLSGRRSNYEIYVPSIWRFRINGIIALKDDFFTFGSAAKRKALLK